MFRTLPLAASAAALMAFAAPANAVALFSAEALATFSTEFDSNFVSVFTNVFTTDEFADTSGAGSIDDFTIQQFEGFDFVSTRGSVAGSATAPGGFAEATLLTDGFISFENTGDEPVILSYSWEIFGQTSASVDDPTSESAFADAFASILAELIDATGASTTVLDFGEGAFADEFFTSNFFEEFDFGEIVLQPGEILEVSLIADPAGLAEVVGGAEVPLPAAAPLLLAGLGWLGVAAARRRR